jgi:hypothetical protein
LPPILNQIINQGYLDEFIEEYCSHNRVEEDFEVNDLLVDYFGNFLNRTGFYYEDQAESAFKEFVDKAGTAQNNPRLNNHLKAIKEILTRPSTTELWSVKPQ